MRNRSFALINIFGLSIGMAVCLVIFQFVYHELSYDTFHKNHSNIYKVVIQETNSRLKESYPSISHGFGPEAKEQLPEVVEFVRKERFNREVIVRNNKLSKSFFEKVNNIQFVDPSFFEVFDFEVIRGEKSTLFSDLYNIVITEDASKRYFGDENPIGQSIWIEGPPSPGKYTVSGIIKNPPINSHLQFEFLIPLNNFLEFGWSGAVKKGGDWHGFSVITYLEIHPEANLNEVKSKLSKIIQSHNELEDPIEEVILQPIADIYLKSRQFTDPGFVESLGNERDIIMYTFIAILILFIAWANYINLSIARSFSRVKEVGIRKSFGAKRSQIINQFLFESFISNLIAGAFALGIFILSLPYLESIIGRQIPLSLLNSSFFIPALVGILITGSIISGIYPALVISRYKPSKSSMTGKTKSKPILRRGLLIFQFVISLALISMTSVIFLQLRHMKSTDLGMELEEIIILKGPRAGDNIPDDRQAFKDHVLGLPEVKSMTGSLFYPGQYWVLRYWREGFADDESPHVRGFYAGLDFPETFDLQLLAGTTFLPSMPDEERVIVNQSAIEAFEFKDIEDALGSELRVGSRTHRIVGVVEDFQWHSPAESHKPYVILLYNEDIHPYLLLNVKSRNMAETVSKIDEIYKNYFPGNPFELSFADDAYNSQYQDDQQFGRVFMVFSSIAIFLACIGLFAIASFTVQARTKELGIRKVLGATDRQLFVLLSSEYAKLFAISLAVALPFIIWWTTNWLENYGNRIDIEVINVLSPILIVGVIVLFTILGKVLSATKISAAEQLKDE